MYVMKKKFSKTEIKEKIDKFFVSIKNKNPNEIKKIKRLSANYNLPLKNNRRKFCKNCFNPFKNSKIRIKNNRKIIECKNCGKISRLRINSS